MDTAQGCHAMDNRLRLHKITVEQPIGSLHTFKLYFTACPQACGRALKLPAKQDIFIATNTENKLATSEAGAHPLGSHTAAAHSRVSSTRLRHLHAKHPTSTQPLCPAHPPHARHI